MKKNRKQLLAIVLVICMAFTMQVPAAAASGSWYDKFTMSARSNGSYGWNDIMNGIDDWLNKWFGSGSDSETETETDTGETSETPELILVEDETTVENGDMLRASTYVLSGDGTSNYAAGTTYIYKNVTLLNYDTTKINNATHQAEVDANPNLTQWNGIYFNTGNPGSESYTYTSQASAHTDLTWEQVDAGTYYYDEGCTKQVSVEPITQTTTVPDYTETSVSCSDLITEDSDQWLECSGYYYTPDGENYYPLYAKRKTTQESVIITTVTYYNYTWGYLKNDNSIEQINNTSQKVAKRHSSYTNPDITVYKNNGTKEVSVTTGYKLIADGTVVTTYNGTDTTNIVDAKLYTKGETASTGSLDYAHWNFWTGFLHSDNTFQYQSNGNKSQSGLKGYVYSGLVKDELKNGQIEFNVPDGGIFDSSDTSTKEVYTGVGLPFVYDETTNYYLFDASQDAAYFSGTPAKETNLTWNDTAQFKQGGNAPAGNGFYPFNNKLSFSESSAVYHFGMIATIEFNMTNNGKLSSTKDQDIVFDFAGDDDVWVFIDGKLVLDIGGIHDSVSGTINFAKNTVSVSATDTTLSSGKFVYGVDDASYSLVDDDGNVITTRLFNDDNGDGILNQSIESFASKDDHILTVYYLERGQGSSNCKIGFNLPMKDSVSVHKTVSDKDSAGASLDSDIIAQIKNREFGFTLYKDGSAVTNATYTLYNIDNQYIATRSTDDNGHFYLKDGYTAKFTGDISDTDGNTYYVVEDSLGSSWSSPVFTYNAKAANGTTVVDSGTSGQSMSITATGSKQAADQINFICTNEMVHVDNTSLEANDDRIVIDYGLPVIIDPLANDVAIGGTKSIVDGSISGNEHGTVTIENGKIRYQLTEQLTEVEVLTYTVKLTATSGVEGDNKTATATIYIIPATSMYYEENFSNLVTFNGNWAVEGTAQTAPQEPGVVGTVGDSPYGSDVAYKYDSNDSNGSSMYADTTSGAAQFSYTFTGTGTTFFARTDSTSAYMMVKVTDSSGQEIKTLYRNNIYTSTDGTNVGTLYNIPVFTWDVADDGCDYGTYTVTVTLLKKFGKNGNTFYLDGIRINNPLNNDNSTNAQIANSAYASDGEANMTIATLRDKLLKDATKEADGTLTWDGTNFVLFTDSNGEIKTADEYNSNGPKEEVYLNKDQSVSFSLTDWDTNTNKIYLGIKAPAGNGQVSINGNPLEIKNAADCYYDISDLKIITTVDGVKIATFNIESTSGLISLTNIKVTGNAEFTIINNGSSTAVKSINYAFEGSTGDADDTSAIVK